MNSKRALNARQMVERVHRRAAVERRRPTGVFRAGDVALANPTIWAPSTSQEGNRLVHGLVFGAASTSELVADVAQQRATRRDVVGGLDSDRR